ncbi:DUF5784 family protein [Halorientalis sp.]|uniref:DUF5784 family protein n=1 Tax=Halorientalis sp. TaxID=1931229 RepID=UPI0026235289|nr:DUF5784 family protein [Halorientalis sp.]
MAKPLRFRVSTERWTEGRVRSDLLGPLDSNLGATMRRPWYKQPNGYEACRFEMDNGDIALFAWNGQGYWLGNTETPSALWRTDKYTFEEVPDRISEWAERELLAQLHEESPWLADYPTISWFFLPVLLSKDGRHTTREFLHDHAAGFPDADPDAALSFYEGFLETDALDDRYTMASKLGTSEQLNVGRMRSTMSEFTVAKLLYEAGYEVTPEIEVRTGHFIDFRADENGEGVLVEVTRPQPPSERAASSPSTSIRETAETKVSGQLSQHEGGVTLFVDCSSFADHHWRTLMDEQPDVRHRPAVVFRAWPDGTVDGYSKGAVPLDLPEGIDTG